MPNEGDDFYRAMMRFKPDGMTPNRWATLAGVSRTVWSDMRRHGNPSRRTLEKLLAAAGSSLAEFEALRVGPASAAIPQAKALGEHSAGAWRGAPLPPLPLFAATPAATSEHPTLIRIEPEPHDRPIPRPQALAADRDAYALIVAEPSMWPRYRIGRQLIVAPGTSAEPGDDVVVRLAGEGGLALIKELVARSAAALTLRQFNPDATFTISLAAVRAVERIAGEAIQG